MPKAKKINLTNLGEEFAKATAHLNVNHCESLVSSLSKIRTEVLHVQERGNADKAKARLVSSCTAWLTSLGEARTCGHWPSSLKRDLTVLVNILTGVQQGAGDDSVPLAMLIEDCHRAADRLKSLTGRLPAAMAPKKSRAPASLEEQPYDYAVGEGSDIIGEFDVAALERQAALVSRVPGINSIEAAPLLVSVQLPLIVEFASYRTLDVFQAQGFTVADIGGHLCFEDQMVLCFNVTRLGDRCSEYIEHKLEEYRAHGFSLAFESPFYFDNHQWRMYWVLPTKTLSMWLKSSTVPAKVGLSFAHRDKPVNPNFLKNLKRREDRRKDRTAGQG